VIEDGVGGVVGWGLGEVGEFFCELAAGDLGEELQVQRDGAGVGGDVGDEEFEESGFSGTVGAEEGEDFSG
jgi:hypothetical protein